MPLRLNVNREKKYKLAVKIPIAKSALSHHFKVLRESGVMYTRIEGISIRTEDLNKRFPGLLDTISQATESY